MTVALFAFQYNAIGDDVAAYLGPDAVILSLQSPLALVLPLAGLLLGHRSVLDERTTGRIKLTAAMPHSRRDIVVGKTVSLAVPLVGLVFSSLAVATVVAVVTEGVPSLLSLFGFAAVSVVYAIVCAGLGIAISVLASSSLRATGAMLCGLLTVFLWKSLATRAYSTIAGVQVNPFDPPADGALFLVRRLDPRSAYMLVTNWVYGVGNVADTYAAAVSTLQAGDGTTVVSRVFIVGPTFRDSPVYLAESTGVVLLLGWLVVPLGIAIARFERTTLS